MDRGVFVRLLFSSSLPLWNIPNPVLIVLAMERARKTRNVAWDGVGDQEAHFDSRKEARQCLAVMLE